MEISRHWPAPAKLNLMLRIVGRRPDGYHELQTVFQFLGISDLLSFRVTSDGSVCLSTPISGVPDSDNLVVKAAKLLQEFSGTKLGVEIQLRKILPMGGGIGGGSSNAATTLVALDQLWATGLGRPALAKLGLKLGADIPIFIHAHSAWAEGIGEKTSDIDLPEPWYLVITPACHVSTAEVFSDPELTRNSPRIKIRDFLQGEGSNDCLPVVRNRYPRVAEALDWLAGEAEAKLTGTGACVYAAFDDEQSAREAQSRMPGSMRGFVAQGCNRSPLLERLQRHQQSL
jgi:4-diphosphocytidyl-2-C-methyl-D-erythritol kinase